MEHHNYNITRLAMTIAALLVLQCRAGRDANRFNVQGPETWLVDGRPYSVMATYFIARLDLPRSPLQFTVEWECDTCKAPMAEAEAARVATPLMRYVYSNGIYMRSEVRLKGKTVAPSVIGVVVGESGANGNRGYRISKSIADIRAMAGNAH